MNTFSVALIRFSQVLVGLFFVFIVSGFFGLMLLFPLAVIYHINNLLSGIGMNGIIALLFSLPMSAGLFYLGYKVEGLYSTILDTGIKLLNLAKTQVLAFESLLPGHDNKTGNDSSGMAESN